MARKAMANMNLDELQVARKAIEDEPAARNEPGTSLFHFTEKVRKRLDKIDREIQFRIGQAREARGETINREGYSGRQSNKRR